MANLKEYVPQCYLDVKDIDAILDVENIEITKAQDFTTQVFLNYYIQTCDESTISKYEELLKIQVEAGATLEERRLKVLLLIASVPPFTDKYLYDLLKNNFEDYKVDIDSVNNVIDIYIYDKNASALSTLYTSLIPVVPAHIVLNIYHEVGQVIENPNNRYMITQVLKKETVGNGTI